MSFYRSKTLIVFISHSIFNDITFCISQILNLKAYCFHIHVKGISLASDKTIN